MFYVDIGVYEMTMLVITEEQGDILCRSGWITTHSIVHTGYADILMLPVVGVYHVTIVAIGHGLLKTFWP